MQSSYLIFVSLLSELRSIKSTTDIVFSTNKTFMATMPADNRYNIANSKIKKAVQCSQTKENLLIIVLIIPEEAVINVIAIVIPITLVLALSSNLFFVSNASKYFCRKLSIEI